MMRVIWALALSGFREAVRNRVTVVVAVFALVTILMTTVVLNVTIFSLDRAVTDFGLGVMSLLLTALAIFTSVGLLTREIERKTIFLVVSRPLSRGVFITGRFLGLMMTLTLLQLAMSAFYATQLWFFNVQVSSNLFFALAGLWVQLLMVTAMGLFFSSMSGAVTSTVSVVGLYLAGYWATDLYALAENFTPGLRLLARAAYWAIPNMGQLDFKMSTNAASAIDAGAFMQAVASGVAWSVLFTIGASVFFSRRDFR